jgi:hypothetical protein
MSHLASKLTGVLRARFRSSSESQAATFTAILRRNGWGDPESVSGPGSTRLRGADFQSELISLIDQWNIGSIVDAPCGDLNWIRDVLAHRELTYTGVDIVAELIERNIAAYATSRCGFVCGDMTRADLPEADLVLCRDGLVHLSFVDGLAAIRNFRRSGSRYLLTTTFIHRSTNKDVPTGGWRALNLQAPPFSLPPPLALLDERCLHTGGAYRDKRLGLWELGSLTI